MAGPVAVDTFGGRVHVGWDPRAAIALLGPLPFFTEFPHASRLFDPWVASCPLRLTSRNAPSPRDVLGTAVLSILAGHHRYAHLSALRADIINPPLLGMSRVVSEDSVRRNFGKLDETEGVSGCRSIWAKVIGSLQALLVQHATLHREVAPT
ncbi:MAG: hypothetical protein MZV65_13490 [Chromatiales bacterium]|nr:hypothetical protein [Chromatiales bacterium]